MMEENEMAGKSKGAKKKRAKTKKRLSEELRQKQKRTVATQAGDEANNNLEPTLPKVNEDAGKPEPFDPQSVVANILKKKDGA